MLIPSPNSDSEGKDTSLSRRVNANSQLRKACFRGGFKLIKKGEC